MHRFHSFRSRSNSWSGPMSNVKSFGRFHDFSSFGLCIFLPFWPYTFVFIVLHVRPDSGSFRVFSLIAFVVSVLVSHLGPDRNPTLRLFFYVFSFF